MMRGARPTPIFAAMPERRSVVRGPAATGALLFLSLAGACGGSDGGPTEATDLQPGETEILAVGAVRMDFSPNQPLTGFLVFFFDLDEERLLSADASVSGLAIGDSIVPGIVPGPVFIRPAGDATVAPGTDHRLQATVRTPAGDRVVTSATVTVPRPLEIRLDDEHPVGQDLRIEWDPPTDADGINVTVGGGFQADLPPTADGITVPANAFAGLGPGNELEVEVTTFDAFFVSVSGGISSLQDAEEFARRFTAGDDNVDGATGAFGAATTAGAIVTLR